MYMNTVTLLGNLGKDPVSYADGKIVRFTMATTRKYRDANGDRKESTEWHNIAVFGKVAEFVMSAGFKKGDAVLVQGSLTYSTYADKETGKNRVSAQINAGSIQLIPVKKTAGGTPYQPPQSSDIPPQQTDEEYMDQFADDLPF